MNTQNLSGKVAIVTGAARGFGKATALRLSREGASVVIADFREELARNTAAEIEAAGGQAMASPADISDPAQVESMVSAAVERFKTIDILVNNAGLMRTSSPMEAIPFDEWQALMTVNVSGVFLCMKSVMPIFKARRCGKIVNVSSSAGRCMSTFCGAHYSASKAAVLGLTRHAANEAAPYNININAVAPGSFETEGGRELLGDVPDDFLDAQAQKIPMGRFGTPEDVAGVIAFLCSREASYITGATIDINGGDLMM